MRSLIFVLLITVPALAAPPADFVSAARSQIELTVRYDAAYTLLDYPGGDVPMDRGVCTDVIVRAMRRVGIDLQEKLHEDMKRSFSAYPKRWGLKAPDCNIDHRRVPNLARYFERQGKKLALTKQTASFRRGWDPLESTCRHASLSIL